MDHQIIIIDKTRSTKIFNLQYMESLRTKVEILKPVFLKAGIPLAISVAGFFIVRIQTRKIPVSKASSLETQSNEGGLCNLDQTTSLSCLEEKKTEEEIMILISRIQDLQERELKIENHFLRYHNLKERELALMECNNNLLLEMARIEFLSREISSIEEENKRFDEMVAEFHQVLEDLEISRCENGLLRMKAKKLLKKNKEFEDVTKKQSLQIEENEAELSRNHQEFERTACTVKELEGKIIELKMVVEKFQEEKDELTEKLEMANKTALSKSETEEMIMGDYNHLLNELEQLQKDRSAEVKELIYLRWCNACLRHELKRRDQEREEQILEGKKELLESDSRANQESGALVSDGELESNVLGHEQSCLGLRTDGQTNSRRRKLVGKLKRWVEGNDKMKGKLSEKEKLQFKSLGTDCARISCSSA